MDKLGAEMVRKPKMDRKWKPTQKWIGSGDKMNKNGREMEWKQKLRGIKSEWTKNGEQMAKKTKIESEWTK